MRVTYYALRTVKVLDEDRQVGDLIPEAAAWPFLPGYIRDGYVAPVLVATLPESVQEVLAEWEADQNAPAVLPAETATAVSTPDTTPAAKSKQKEKVA